MPESSDKNGKPLATIVAIIGIIGSVFLITKSVTQEAGKNTALLSQRIEAIETHISTLDRDVKRHVKDSVTSSCKDDIIYLKEKIKENSAALEKYDNTHANKAIVENHIKLDGHVVALQRITRNEGKIEALERAVYGGK